MSRPQRRSRLRSVALLICALLPAMASPAAAEGVTSSVQNLQLEATGVSFTWSASRDDKPVDLTAAGQFSAQFTPEGSARSEPVPVTVARPESGQAQTSVVLAVDVSASMNTPPAKLTQARAAASGFVKALDPDVELKVITFGSTITTSPSLGTLTATATKSRMYDAILTAIKELPRSGHRAIVVISDGDSTGDAHTAAEVTAALAKSRPQLSIVTIDPSPAALATAKSLVKAGAGGSVLATGSSALASTLKAQARQAQEFAQVQVQLNEQQRGQAGAITVRGTLPGGQAVQAQVTNPVQATRPAAKAAVGGSAHPVASTPAVVPPGAAIAGLALFFVAMLIASSIGLGAVTGGPAKDGALKLVQLYRVQGGQATAIEPKAAAPSGLSRFAIGRALIGALTQALQQRRFTEELDARLEATGLPLRTAEWLVVHTACSLAGGGLLYLIGGMRLLSALAGLVLGAVVPWVVLGVLRSRREQAFLDSLPDTLHLMSGSLKAGYSLPQSIEAVADESQGPIGVEFSRAILETRLGRAPEDALAAIAERTRSRDFTWVVMAIRIQREVGGNLAELLTTVASTIRERQRLQREVRALSAEGRLSAWILGLLPVVFAGYLAIFNPIYLAPLLNTPLGRLLIIVCLVLTGVGAEWMRRTVKVSV